MTDEPTRPVFFSREQYNMLRSLMQTWPEVAKPIVAAWEAAPADAAVNVRDTLILTVGIGSMERCIGPVLRALGIPEGLS